MADGDTVMQSWIDRLRKLGQSTEDIAADIAPELRDELEGNIAASRAPDGPSWQPTLAGTPPLAGAAKALGSRSTTRKLAFSSCRARRSKASLPNLPLPRIRYLAKEITPGAEIPPPRWATRTSAHQ